jgi:AAA family ATP:ADP antiporter
MASPLKAILKPIKKTLFLGHYKVHGAFDTLGGSFTGPQAELFAKVGNMFMAFAAVVVFSKLANTLRRQQLTFVFAAFCAACTFGFLLLAISDSELGVWLFYLYGDLFNTLMVATFFAFLNDSFSPSSAKRNYGPIILGGVAGGAFGSLVVQQFIDNLSTNQWLWITLGTIVAIAGLAAVAGKLVAKNPPREVRKEPTGDVEKRANAAIEGAQLVFKSRYLLAIVAIVGLYEIISTILDFQFTATIYGLLEPDAADQQLANVYLITNVFALAFQLFLTSFILTRFGVKVALLIMPVAILAMSGSYAALPILWIGSLLNTADNGFNYSINQSAREALYTPTSRDEKYKAKAFIDMFVQRFGKAVAVFVTLAITKVFDSLDGVRYLSFLVIALVAVWLVAALYAGRRFEELTDDDED